MLTTLGESALSYTRVKKNGLQNSNVDERALKMTLAQVGQQRLPLKIISQKCVTL
jgi:hypothetical protein